MEDACAEMKHEVRHRSVDARTVEKEIVLEMERVRRLQRIKQEKGLEIVIEEPEARATE